MSGHEIEDILIEDICKSFDIGENISTCTNNKPATIELTIESILTAKRLLGCVASSPPAYMTKGFDFGKADSSFGVFSLWKPNHARLQILYGYKLVSPYRKLITIHKNLHIYGYCNNKYFYQPCFQYEAVWHNGERRQVCSSVNQAKKIIDIALFFNEQIYEVKL